MKLRHVALVYSSEDKADRFLGSVLGLRKSEPKTLAVELGRAIFGTDSELRMINYLKDDLLFEVFIVGGYRGKDNPVEHVCLEVEDLPDFLERCRRANASVNKIPRGDSVLVFVADEDSNLFEIKEKRAGA